MTTTTDLRRRWYRAGRRDYGLGAVDALTYARQRYYLWQDDTPLWDVEPDDDEPGTLCVFVYEDDEATGEPVILASLGAVDMPFTVSDHGNVIVDQHDPYLIAVAADLAEQATR